MNSIIETYGECSKCGVQEILGNGLCTRCWEGSGSREYIHRNIKVISPQIIKDFPDKSYCIGCGKGLFYYGRYCISCYIKEFIPWRQNGK